MGRSALTGRGRLPKSARVRERREYDKIHQRGVRVQRTSFTLICCRSIDPGAGGARFGCAVSRKVGNAVTRNRLKRLMREVFRQCRERLPKVDLVVILRPSAESLTRGGLEAMSAELLPAFEEASNRALSAPKGHGRRRGGRRRPSKPDPKPDPER